MAIDKPATTIGRGAAEESRAGATREAGKALTSIGGILAALGASSCCVVPFVLVSFGAGGAWLGNLTVLAPYQPFFVALTVAFLAGGFYMVYRKPKLACADGSYCARPASDRFAKIGLWAATVLVGVALAFPYVAPLFIEL